MPKPRAKDGLTDKQRKFCREYVKDLNSVQAAFRAHYSANSCRSIGQENLTKPAIKNEIVRLQANLTEKEKITPEMVIAELKKIGFANIQDYIEDDNEIVDLSKIPRDVAAAVESVQTDIRHDSGKSEGYTEKVKFKLHSKLDALEQLGKHLGLFKADNEQQGGRLMIVFQGPRGAVIGRVSQIGSGADRSSTALPDAQNGQEMGDKGQIGQNDATGGQLMEGPKDAV